MLLLDLDTVSLSRALLWLPTADALRAGQAATTLRSLFLGGGSPGSQWHSLLGAHVRGQHSACGLWLHGVATTTEIARYVAVAKRFSVLGAGLSFGCANEVWRFTAVGMLDGSDPGCGGSFFAGCFSFSQGAASAHGRAVVGIGQTLWSQPQSFSWTFRHCHMATFDVYLAAGPSPSGRPALWWEHNFSGEIRQEEMDYIEVYLSGYAVLPGGRWHVALGSSPLDATTPAGADAALEQAVLRGEPLLCFLRVLFRSAGEEQPVVPSAQARAAQRAAVTLAEERGGTDPEPSAAEQRSERRAPRDQVQETTFDEQEFEAFLSTAHVATG